MKQLDKAWLLEVISRPKYIDMPRQCLWVLAGLAIAAMLVLTGYQYRVLLDRQQLAAFTDDTTLTIPLAKPMYQPGSPDNVGIPK